MGGKRGGKGGYSDESGQNKCGQCRQWEKEGDWYGRRFYCARCWAKYEQQTNSDEYHRPEAGVSGTDAEFLNGYKERWRELIELEWNAELSIINDRLENWGVERLVRQGYTIVDAWAQKRGQFFGKAKVIFSKDWLGKHQFTSGDEVLVSREDPLKDRKVWKGEVIELGPSRITIVTDDAPVEIRRGTWRLDCGANKTAYERTKTALGYITGPKFKQEKLRRLVLQEDKEEIGNICDESQVASIRSETLNLSQVAAIQGVETKNIGLIQGPPGTGKTTTTCHMIKRMAQRYRNFGEKHGCSILVAADSNVAVDQLLEGLIKLGMNALRIGFPSKVTEELRNHTLLAKCESHPLATKMEETREALQRVKDDLYSGNCKGKGKGMAHRDISLYVNDLQKMTQQMNDELIRDADVICSTLIGCGCDALLQVRFPTVIIDEASQATEPRCLVAIQKAEDQLLLVGDQQQLPPVVICEEAEAKGLKFSLFDRLLMSDLFCGNIHMLRVQYRMHPLIRQWPSEEFYSGNLEDGANCKTDRKFYAFPANVTFIDTCAGIASKFLKTYPAKLPHESSRKCNYDANIPNEEHTYTEGSKYNALEVEVVRLVLDLVMNSGIRPSDIGIISPYTAQVSEIKNSLQGRSGGLEKGGVYKGVEIKTVDGYQGREKEVIILSCVRTRNLGFLTDHRRLNVAITRAKRGLIVIGHSDMLAMDETWRSWLGFVEHFRLGVQV